MSEGSRVDNDRIASTSSRMHCFDEFPFVIALKIFHFATKFGRYCTRTRHMVGERVVSVDIGFALSEQVEIRSVEEQDKTHVIERYRPAAIRYST